MTSACSRQFKDTEMDWFYIIEVGICLFAAIVIASQHEFTFSIFPIIATLGFLLCGPPLRAQVMQDGSLIFKGPLRHTKITVNSLANVKAVGAKDYRAHIVLRNKWGLPVMYRNRKYQDRSILALAVLALIEQSANVRVTNDALKLLRQSVKEAK